MVSYVIMPHNFSVEVGLWDSSEIYEKVLKEDDGWLGDTALDCIKENYSEIKLDVIGPKFFEGELITESEIPNRVRIKIKNRIGEKLFIHYPFFVILILDSFTVQSTHSNRKTITAHYVYDDCYY
jgi:hypothetical protein